MWALGDLVLAQNRKQLKALMPGLWCRREAWLPPCPQLCTLTALTHKHKSLGPLSQGTQVPMAPRASVLRDGWPKQSPRRGAEELAGAPRPAAREGTWPRRVSQLCR